MFVVWFGLSGSAWAHAPGLSQGGYRVDGRRVHVDIVLARGEAAQVVPGVDADRDGAISEIELLQVQEALAAALSAGVEIRDGAAACPGAVDRVTFVEEDGLAFAADFTCPEGQPLAALTVRLPVLARLASGHRHVGQVWFVGAAAAAAAQPLESAAARRGEPVDFVMHRRRAALTIRRPTTTAVATTPGAPPEAHPSPVAPTAERPATARVEAPRWRIFAGLAALFGLAGLVIHRVRAGRRRGA